MDSTAFASTRVWQRSRMRISVVSLIAEGCHRIVEAGPASDRPQIGDQSWRSDVGGLSDRCRPDLVEAGAAIDGAIVPGRERHHCLAPATATNRGVELPRSASRSSALCDRPASWTTLWVVQQTLATEKGLLAAGEDEFLRAIATGQRSILIHPLPNLLFMRYGG